MSVEDDRIVATEARAGVTGHNVRYVRLLGTCGVITLFVAIYLLVGG